MSVFSGSIWIMWMPGCWRLGACWLQVNYCDAVAALSRDVSIKQAELVVKRQDRAHRRYLTALGALATLRRLLPAAGLIDTRNGIPSAEEPGSSTTDEDGDRGRRAALSLIDGEPPGPDRRAGRSRKGPRRSAS